MTDDHKNQGEGDRTAARRYNEKTEEFAESGRVAEKAEEARDAIEGEESEDLKRAEQIGRAAAKEEDSKVKDG